MMTDSEWQQELDKLHTNLRYAEAGLREAKADGSPTWIETAQNRVDQVNAEILEHDKQRLP
jgi:hypothetical protein